MCIGTTDFSIIIQSLKEISLQMSEYKTWRRPFTIHFTQHGHSDWHTWYGARLVEHQAVTVLSPQPQRGPSAATGKVNQEEKRRQQTAYLVIWKHPLFRLSSHSGTLQEFLKREGVDIICIQETHLIDAHCFTLRGYELFQHDRAINTREELSPLSETPSLLLRLGDQRERVSTLPSGSSLEDASPLEGTSSSSTTEPSTQERSCHLCPKHHPCGWGWEIRGRRWVTCHQVRPSRERDHCDQVLLPIKDLQQHTLPLVNHILIITGDFNGHSPSCRYADLHSRGEQIKDWMIENSLILINRSDDQPTHLSYVWKTLSTSYLAITSENIQNIYNKEVYTQVGGSDPSKTEIKKAIMTLRSGKAAGPDEIPAEAIKADTETAVQMLYSLFSKIWEKEEVPAQWKEGIIIKLPKKGDLRDCSNYRGIMLLSTPGKVLNRILLERMKEAVDPKLRDQQAGFRQNRSCADQIASLRIIVEQSLEWNSPLYINFIDYEKAFDSVDRETLWKLLRHYGVPKKIISLIRCTFQDMSCKIAHAGQLSDSFEVKTGVRQGCLLSPFLFLLVIDWIMKTTTTGRNNGIQWTLWTQLDDLDFADDLALLSHNHSQMQDKTTLLETTSAGTGLKINRKKTELMKMNTTANAPITVGGEPLREVESFVYLGSVVDHQGGTDRDVTARIGKARAAFVMLKNIWASGGISMRTKLRIFNSNVKSVLLYGCETWRTTQTMQRKIQTFFNTCLRRIYKIQWQEKIRNEELWERAGQEPVAKQILRRKWGWIGHTLRKPASSTTRQALTWNPQGKRKRGRPRNSWRRDTEAELKQQGTNWSGMTRAAQNRVRWRGVVDGLCSTGSDGHK